MKIPFNRDHFGKKMNGHLVKAIPVLPVNGLTMCVYECLVTPKCFSLNYYPDSALCELNSEDSVTSSGSFVDYEGHVTYTDIAAWPTVISYNSLYNADLQGCVDSRDALIKKMLHLRLKLGLEKKKKKKTHTHTQKTTYSLMITCAKVLKKPNIEFCVLTSCS